MTEITSVFGRVEGQDNTGKQSVGEPNYANMHISGEVVKIRIDSEQIPSF